MSPRSLCAAVLLCALCGSAVAANNSGNAASRRNKNLCTAFQDTFSTGQLDGSRWIVASGYAPGYIANQHVGYYDPQNVVVSPGMLRLTLTQGNGAVDTNPSGVISNGAAIYTKLSCGYGAYEWTMKMSSTSICATCVGPPVSGSVSAGFSYINNSETEIDFEFSAKTPDTLWLVNWLNTNTRYDPTGSMETYTGVTPFDSTSGFHTYRYVWSLNKISFYIDGVWKADHTTNVPSAPAPIFINHWGTDSDGWGGRATVGSTRYLYVSRVSFTPQ
jgi:beta-glucanase (GH16 family)